MKKIIFTSFFVVIILSGCSVLEEVNDSLDYANEAKDHVNMLSNFGEEAPQLVREAISNSESKEELENQLLTVKSEIEEFNEINVPSLAEDIHQEIVNKNELITAEIESIMENGDLAIDSIENSQIFTTINEVTNLLNKIEELGL